MKTETISMRVEPGIKKAVEKILNALGLTTTDAITIFLHKVAMEEGLPFDVRMPNAQTQKAMKESMGGKNFKSFKSIEEAKRYYRHA